VPSAAAADEPKPVLPALKPILKKPFPEGADEATVCEAIDSTEPDLWVRFGHIVPVYYPGVIYILETGPENKDKLFHYIANDYVTPFGSWQASCRGKLTLLYIRTMLDVPDDRGKPVGLGQAVEKEFGIKTRESFQLRPDQGRLSDYCRTDAELCDRLAKLDFPNSGKGLCSGALTLIGISSTNDDYEQQLAACRALPPTTLVCAYFAFNLRPGKESAIAREACRDKIKNALTEQTQTMRPR
jgi:hypothetical protein